METPIVQLDGLRHAYGENEALRGISLSVPRGILFGLLGPNGSGKTTLFRILSTVLLPVSGRVSVDGVDLYRQPHEVRKRIGVVFQSPSLDPKLTVRENLIHQGHLYGLRGASLERRIREMLSHLGITERSRDLTGKLSGGLKRRVEIAKGMLHQPTLLILDEPSTGLDPGARLDLWRYLKMLRDRDRVSVLVTTHLMEEAEQCDRVGILSRGQLVKSGDPESLKREIGGDVVLVRGPDAEGLAAKVRDKFAVDAAVVDGTVQIEHPHGARFVAQIAEAFPGEIESVTFRKPTLEDVFIHQTGHRFWAAEPSLEEV